MCYGKGTMKGKSKPKKDKKKNVCLECPSLCCRDLSIPTTRPRTRFDIDQMKWYLHFDTVSVYVRNHRWYLLIKGKCMYLGEDTLCTNYENRPDVCREHNPPDCERYADFFDVMITTPDELDEFLKPKKKTRKRRARG